MKRWISPSLFLPLACLAAFALVGVFANEGLAQIPDPVAHWTFDGFLSNYNQTTIPDAAGNNNTASWEGNDSNPMTTFDGLGFVAGQIGGAVKLGGGDDQFFSVGNIAQIANTVAVPAGTPIDGTGFSISAWINVDVDAVVNNRQKGVFVTRSAEDVRNDQIQGQVTDVEQNYGIAFEDNDIGSNRIDSRVSGRGLDSGVDSIIRGQWHHVVLVWGIDDDLVNPETMSVDPNAALAATQATYIDGQVVNSEVLFFDDNQIFQFIGATNWGLGEDPTQNAREFDGALDDVAVFDEALSSADVAALFTDGGNGINAAGANTASISIADVNLANGVTIADFNIIRDNLGADDVSDRSMGDINGDRRVDLNDFQLWLESVSPLMAAQALSGGAVPEPSTTLLLLVGSGLMVGRRQRRIIGGV